MASHDKKNALIQATGLGARVNITNNITFGDINLNFQSEEKSTLPPDTPIAIHYFLKREMVCGTKAGPLTIKLPSRVLNENQRIVHSILEKMSESDFLAPLEDENEIT